VRKHKAIACDKPLSRWHYVESLLVGKNDTMSYELIAKLIIENRKIDINGFAT
jgi:hypothetical protein